MSFLDYFLGRRRNTAEVAKERLQIILAHERSRTTPDYLPDLQREILAVVAKYIKIDLQEIRVKLEREGDYEVLELNIPLPEDPKGTTIRATTNSRPH
ncbi:Z-ring positioning protein MinE [Gammaproteobacteria bacterium]